MPDDGLKTKTLGFLSSQTPRVLIAIVTIGALGGMAWFEKLTDVLAICIAAVGCFALLMNYLIVKKTRKESGS